MLTVPSVIKHHSDPLATHAAHLASGTAFMRNHAEVFRELFVGNGDTNSDEVHALYGLLCLRAARSALGERDFAAAERLMTVAAMALKRHPSTRLLGAVARWLPNGPIGRLLSGAWRRAEDVVGRFSSAEDFSN